MKSPAFSFALCLAMLAMLPVPARAQGNAGTITWLVNNFPPYTMVDGPGKGAGIVDQLRDKLVARLPNYRHDYVVAVAPRMIEMMKSDPTACSSTLMRDPEREKVMEFTAHPIVRILPNGIITTKERARALAPYLDASGELRLDAALVDGKFKLGVNWARSYGPHIDGIFNAPAARKQLVTLANIQPLGSKLAKLSAGDRDYDMLIAYAIEMKAATAKPNKLDLDESDFAYIPIEGETRLLPVPVSCARGDFGRKVIAAIDNMLDDPSFQQEAAQTYRRWLSDDAARLYDRLLKQP